MLQVRSATVNFFLLLWQFLCDLLTIEIYPRRIVSTLLATKTVLYVQYCPMMTTQPIV